MKSADNVFPKGKREELIGRITDVLYDIKAYKLPAACVRVGLTDGDPNEAHASKRLYVGNRLEPLSDGDLIQIARNVDHEYPTATLSELVSFITDASSGPELSDLTRRAIFNELDHYELFGKLQLVDELEKLWPISQMSSPYDRMDSLKESIYQHCLRNGDWSNTELLEYVGAMTCSRTLFFKLLEAITSPNARHDASQQNLVESVNKHLKADGYHFVATGSISGYPVYTIHRIAGGVSGAPKNLIFAADGPKPEIVFADAINNDIKIVKNEQNCLIYERPIGSAGLSKADLLQWWQDLTGATDDQSARRDLVQRLRKSLASDGERNLFDTYYKTTKAMGDNIPALIPQVYLHYDPYTIKQLGGVSRLPRQRMDFLLLFSSSARVILEVDGKQHFADGEQASLNKYAEMMSADRDLRLAGYEVYRFGANELTRTGADELLADFFRRLLLKAAK